MQRLLIALIVLAGACGGDPPGRSEHHDDDHGDDDCVVDTCGVCDGDGTTCIPESEIVLVLQVEGATLGVFPFVRGLGSANELVSTAGGTVVPGKLRHLDVSLTRQANESIELASWRKSVEDGSPATQLATLTLTDSVLGTIARWELLDAWPSSLDVSQDAAGLHETVIVTNAGVRVVAP